MNVADAIQLRRAQADEADILWVLRTRCVRETCCSHYPPEVIAAWSATPPPARYRELLSGGGGVVAQDAARRVLGYGVIDLAANEIDALFVDPDCAGRGIGQQLMRAMEAMAVPEQPLELSASLNAVAFYRRAGFEVLREEAYPHASGIQLASVRMRKVAASSE